MALQVGELFSTLRLDKEHFNKGLDEAEKKFSGLKGTLGSLAAGASAALGAGLVAGFSGAVMGADNLKQALNGLQTQTGSTGEEMKVMEQSLRNIYANNYGESFQDIADSMAQVKQATGSAGAALENLTTDALKLRDTFGYEVAESARTAQTMMKNFGITGEQAMTLIAQGAQKGLDKHGDMLDTFNEYSVYFKQMGFDAEGMFNILADGAKSGAFNLDKVGDAIKEMGIRVKDGSKTSKEAFQMLGFNADKMSQKFAAGGATAQKAFTKVMTKLSKMEDPVKRNTVGVGLMGTQFEDLEHKAITSLANVQQKADMNAGTLKEIGNIKYDSFQEAIKGIGRQFVNGLFIPLGKKILPKLNELAGWIKKNMPKIKQTIQTAMAGAQAAFQSVIKALGFLKRNADIIVPAITAMAAVIAGYFVPTLYAMASAAVASMAATAAAFWPITVVTAAVGAAVAGLALVWRKWGDQIKAFTIQMVNTVVLWFQNLWTRTKEIFTALKAGLIATWQNIKSTVVNVVTVLVNTLQTWFTNAKDNLSGIITVLKDFFVKTWENLKLAVMSIVGAFLSLLTGDFEGFKLSMQGLLAALKRQFENIWSTIKDLVIEYVKLLVKGAKTAFDAFKNGLFAILRAIGDFFVAVWRGIRDNVVHFAKGLRDGVTNFMTNAKDNIVDIWNKARDFLKGIDLREIGEDIMRGLLNGISSMAGAIWDKVNNIVDGIKDKIKGALSIASPSKVMQKYGEWTGEGLGKGIENMQGFVERSSQKLADSAVPQMSPVAVTGQTANGNVNIGRNGSRNNGGHITNIIELDSREIGRKTAPYTADEIRTRTGIR